MKVENAKTKRLAENLCKLDKIKEAVASIKTTYTSNRHRNKPTYLVVYCDSSSRWSVSFFSHRPVFNKKIASGDWDIAKYEHSCWDVYTLPTGNFISELCPSIAKDIPPNIFSVLPTNIPIEMRILPDYLEALRREFLTEADKREVE